MGEEGRETWMWIEAFSEISFPQNGGDVMEIVGGELVLVITHVHGIQ